MDSVPPSYKPEKAIQLLREQIERLSALKPRSLKDPEWEGWRRLTAEILDRAFGKPQGFSHQKTSEFLRIVKDAAGDETEGDEIAFENLRRKEQLYLESLIDLLALPEGKPMQKKSATAVPTDTVAGPTLEVAHVLFTDLVGYSQLPMDQGAQLVERLTAIVEGTKAFRRAKNSNQLILLPTGDGMALAFFGDPLAPVKCAVEISRVLRSEPELKLRMGIHSGPVFRTIDINEASNVAGGGINLAQRVMDCGDEGHILLSQSIADVLRQLSNWREHFHDVGIQEVKHGEQLHIFNLHGSDFGNPQPPKKSQRQEPAPSPGTGKQRVAVLAAAAVIAIAVIAFSWNPVRCTIIPDATGCSLTLDPSMGRMFNYWITLQKYRDGRPFEDPIQLTREVLFEADYRIFLHLTSPQDGYLYIINEGPYPIDGLPSYNVLFPNTLMNNGEPFLPAGAGFQIPESGGFAFDQEKGREKLWLIWATEAVPELEAVKDLANPTDQGVIRDAGEKQAIQRFLARHSSSEVAVEELEREKQTLVSTRESVLVHLVPLEHY